MENPMRFGDFPGGLSRLSHAKTRSVSAENFTGEKGRGGMALEGTGANAARALGQGWKVSPSILLKGGSTATLAQIEGPGVIQHFWITGVDSTWRHQILRCYWDGEETPSVEAPLGDFFCQGWCKKSLISSLAVCCILPAGSTATGRCPSAGLLE